MEGMLAVVEATEKKDKDVKSNTKTFRSKTIPFSDLRYFKQLNVECERCKTIVKLVTLRTLIIVPHIL